MKKYHWKDATLRKKAKVCDRLMLTCAVLAFGIWVFALNVPLWVLLGLVVGMTVCAVLSWKIQAKDKRVKSK